MRSAIEVANWIIAHGAGLEITNLKMQSLLFIGFGLHTARFNEQLFYDPIEAWKYGPVVQSVFHSLKFQGIGTIELAIVAPDGTVPMLADTERNAILSLRDMLKNFGRKSPQELMRWSHTAGGPWEQTYDERQGGFREIDKQLIRRTVLDWIEQPVPKARLRAL